MTKIINQEDIKKSVEELNKDASKSTKITYYTSFNRFFKYLTQKNITFNNFEEFLKYLTINYKSLLNELKVESNNSKENLIKAIIKYNRLLKLDNTEEFNSLNDTFLKIINANKLIRAENIENEKSKDLKWNDLVDYFNNNLKDVCTIDIKDKIIMSFYINNPPLRSSNLNNLIYRNNIKSIYGFNPNFNYYLPNIKIIKI